MTCATVKYGEYIEPTLRLRPYLCPECGSGNTSVSRLPGRVEYACRDCRVLVVRRSVRKCPTCGSTELYYEAGLITGQKYHCKRCNYIGPLVYEEDVEERVRR